MVTSSRIDVLIVGAGPVGLFLANECIRRGLSHRIVETRSSQSTHSKALAIFPRTLEAFDMAGVSGPFVEAANRVTSISVIAHQRPLAEMDFRPQDTPYPFIAMVPQDVTESLLLKHLESTGGAVEYETTFLSADALEDRAVAHVDQLGKAIDIEASFVVGCDGSHSAVRGLLGSPFEGGEYAASFMLADVDTNDALPADQMQVCPHESGPLAIFPMSTSRRRIVATVEDQEGDAPSLELTRRLLVSRGPVGMEARALRWSSYFRIHHRQVATLRAGRFFIAGDAAHIHSPFGGQGMNTGLQDAWNLAWKLDLASRGRASDLLLDSYTAERRPVIKQVMEGTDLLTKGMATPNKLAQALRDVLIPAASHLPPFAHAFVNRLSGLGISYPGSPVIDGPGERCFEESMRGGQGIGRNFLLLCDEPGATAMRDALGRLPERLRGLIELRSVRRNEPVLVRPDGYIACAGRHHSPANMIDSVRSVLERQIV
jgi:2-polyprenyl-6-methoxyphenol hydroxylase-like FAD-dependent oxidoreductase